MPQKRPCRHDRGTAQVGGIQSLADTLSYDAVAPNPDLLSLAPERRGSDPFETFMTAPPGEPLPPESGRLVLCDLAATICG
jgi:hypothetical protein